MKTEKIGVDRAKVKLACSELEYEWRLDELQKKKIDNILGGLESGFLSQTGDFETGLYRGFVLNTDDKFFRVIGNIVLVFQTGIVEIKYDKMKEFEKAVLDSAPINMLPEIVHMHVSGSSKSYQDDSKIYRRN
ncbi:MAG: hypothetical protein PHN88_08785 [Ignavibacteria bacterium]|nr:hypothetical protein [Ignavibacteria bacterium]